tara:strand:+ start:35 stop:823 length:789 start_codon:yes stop_codon:yes gene_type:complete
MLIQLILSIFITPQTLNYSRSILKNSELQFVPSLLKEKQFNDTVEGLTIFVDKKEPDGKYKNIFIRDDGNVLTKVSKGTSTIFAKSGFVSSDEKSLILLNGIIQKFENNKSINMITFEKTVLNLSGLSTKSITEPKLQETSTFLIIKCMTTKNVILLNCNTQNENKKDTKIEINKRFGMPLFIPLISLMVCFLLSFSQKTIFGLSRHLYFFLGFVILLSAEITVRYSGNSLNHTLIYYFIPIALIPIFYFILIKKFKYENLY